MKFLICSFIVIISGCAYAPVKPEFPKATPILMQKCEELQKIEGNTVTITEMLKTIVNNYTLYYECSTKVEGWQDWYIEQKKIYESIK
jgi:hypothetical protein